MCGGSTAYDCWGEAAVVELTASVAQARAALAVAQANRDHVYADVRDEEIAGVAAEVANGNERSRR
jgi:hypothetical protein